MTYSYFLTYLYLIVFLQVQLAGLIPRPWFAHTWAKHWVTELIVFDKNDELDMFWSLRASEGAFGSLAVVGEGATLLLPERS